MAGNFLTDAAVVVVVLGVMIFVHELGHFMAAKWFGVRVLTFSLGFGRRLFGIKRGGTDYRVSALPFGGYVKMAGDNPSEALEGVPGEFLARPRWQRFFIVLMGPAMNVVMAVVLLAGLYRFHFPKPAYKEEPARVGFVDPDSPASRAGVLTGDLIVRLGNLRSPRWEDVELKVLTSAEEALPLIVRRVGRERELTITPRASGREHMGYAGWDPYSPAVVESVDRVMPAGEAGIKPGDQIVALDGNSTFYWPRFAYMLQAGGGEPVELRVVRKGKEFSVRIKPVYSEVGGEKKWRIGVAFRSDMVVRQLPWGRAIAASLAENARGCLLTFDVLSKILTRRMAPQAISGPIGMAQISGEAYRAGVPYLLHIVSMISLQLAIFNLLPIPILDGGVILLLLIEGAIRRDLSLEFKERVVQVGFFFLLLLAVFVMYNDIMKTIHPS